MQSNEERLIELGKNVTTDWLKECLSWCIHQIEKNGQRYKEKFPSACATNGIYRIKDNDDWTNGFWTGMLWLSYQMTGKELFKATAMKNVASFQKRLDDHFVLDHHDIGFLYSLSAVAGFQITGEKACEIEIKQAADVLKSRYHEKGKFIQAWGKYGDPKENRLIIDSLLNLPLLFRASQLTKDQSYYELAKAHYQTLLNTVIREDGTTFHTYFFDPKTQEPTHGATHQGHSDGSIWARGQSWAILGIPLVQSYLESSAFPRNYQQIVKVFLSGLPEDLVPYWDFDFTDKNPSAKDSSSLAIAACGLLEASKTNHFENGKEIAKGMVYQLGQHYFSKGMSDNEGLLIHGVYAFSEGKGVDEPNLWGDYFFMEALVRLLDPDWKKYW